MEENVFTVDGDTAVRHAIRGRNRSITACGIKTFNKEEPDNPPTHASHDLPNETRCTKCYPEKK